MKYLLTICLIFSLTSAQWSSDPAAPQSLGSGVQAQVAATSDGGVYIAWLTDGNYHVYIQRLDAAGEAQFEESGMLVSDQPNSSWIAVHHMNLAVDGNDNAIISTLDTRTGLWQVYAYKISPDGSMIWGEDGLVLSASGVESISPRLTVLLDNSVVVTWTHNWNAISFQRVSSDGELLWGDGILIEDDDEDATLISPQPIVTAEGDVLIQWIRQSGPYPWAPDSELYLQKYDYDGNPLWSEPTIAVGPEQFPNGNWLQESVAESSGGSFSAWTDFSGSGGNQNAVAQHITGDGGLSWTGGVDLSTNTSNFRISPRLTVAEESQELMAVWGEANGTQSQHGVYAQRLDSNGNRLWGSYGIAVVGMNSDYVYLDLSVAGFDEELITAYIQQYDYTDSDIYATRLDADGNSVWLGGSATVTNSGNPKSDMMIGKGPGYIFIAWTENGSVYAHCLREDGTLGAPDVSSSDCTADDGTEGVELWGECYSIENTTELDLPNSGLSGEIPPEIGNLTNLTSLWLSSNELTGSIPPEIGNLTNLTELTLSSNELTGSIPPEIGNLTNLTLLYLNYNELTGSIPLEICNLNNLTYLYLDRNQFTGEIPSEIGNLTNLTMLELTHNQLTGLIPSGIGNLTNLTSLWLSSNELTGSIPLEICNLNNLTYLYLDRNQFTGEIPSEIGNLTNLEYLYFFNNQLTGTIPPEIGNLTNLTNLSFSSNQLTGEIPSEIGNLTNLIGLQLNDNEFTGEIPESICELTNLNWSPDFIDWGYSYFYNNQLCPPYPFCIEDYVGEQDTTNCDQVYIIDGTLPISYTLHNAYPNPFNPVTTIRFDLPEDADVQLLVYDVLGREVAELVSGRVLSGFHEVIWDASDVSSGIYLCQLTTLNSVITNKMVVVK